MLLTMWRMARTATAMAMRFAMQMSDGDGYPLIHRESTIFSSRMPSCDGEGEGYASHSLQRTATIFLRRFDPGAAEVIGDGVDSDCDGTELCYVDADGDGFAAGELTIESADAYCTSVGEAGAEACRAPTAMMPMPPSTPMPRKWWPTVWILTVMVWSNAWPISTTMGTRTPPVRP